LNYYKRHIGDYMKDASHLTLLEHGVYTRLMDVYYTRESGIPVDQAARLVGARSKDELAALAQVVGEFFTVVDGCYTQSRCARVIAEMLDKAETNRVVGKRGGRPKKQTATVDSGNPEITQMVSEKNPDETQAISHKPIANINTEGRDARATRLPAGLTLPDDWRSFCQSERPDLDPGGTYAKFCDYWTAKPGKAGTKLDWMATWRNWVREEKHRGGRATDEPAWRTEQRNRTLQAVPNLVGQTPAEFFDVESKNVTAPALG